MGEGGVRSFGRLIAITLRRNEAHLEMTGSHSFFSLLGIAHVYKCYIYIHTDLIQVINRRFNLLTRGISCFKKKFHICRTCK